MRRLKQRRIESWSPLLHQTELLFSGITPLRAMVPSVPQLPPLGPGKKQNFSTADSMPAQAASAVRGPEIKCWPRKEKVGVARHKKAFGPAREGGDSWPRLVHTLIPGWIILGRKSKLRYTYLFKRLLDMPL